MTKDYFKEPLKVVRLWNHEVERVFSDRMISDVDSLKFNEFRVNVTKKYFDDVNQVSLLSLMAREHLVDVRSWQAAHVGM